MQTIYEIPLVLHSQGFDKAVFDCLNMKSNNGHKDIIVLENSIQKFKNPDNEVNIAICGKYNGLHDAYKSILEAFIHSGIYNDAKINVKWIDTEQFEKDMDFKVFDGIDGILIPGGFGYRGIEGKIIATQYARENNIPFLGICLGMQCAVIEFSRNVCNLKKSNSTEFDLRTNHPVIDLMPSQKKVIDKGATMRLGKYSCTLSKRSQAYQAYGKININERHRHRYEVNNRYKKQLEKKGLSITGVNKKLDLVEIVEIKDHNWFVGVQFHPELKSRIVNVHPLFKDFISAAIKFKS